MKDKDQIVFQMFAVLEFDAQNGKLEFQMMIEHSFPGEKIKIVFSQLLSKHMRSMIKPMLEASAHPSIDC